MKSGLDVEGPTENVGLPRVLGRQSGSRGFKTRSVVAPGSRVVGKTPGPVPRWILDDVDSGV